GASVIRPAWRDGANICMFTSKKNWSPPQRRMMRKASRYHVLRSLAFAALLAVATLATIVTNDRVVEQRKVTQAAGLVQRLLDAETGQVPAIVAEMSEYRTWTDPLLRQENERAAADSRQQLHTSLALLPVDRSQ